MKSPCYLGGKCVCFAPPVFSYTLLLLKSELYVELIFLRASGNSLYIIPYETRHLQDSWQVVDPRKTIAYEFKAFEFPDALILLTQKDQVHLNLG